MRTLVLTRKELAQLNVRNVKRRRVAPHRPLSLGPQALLDLARKPRPVQREHNMQVEYFTWVATELEALYPGISDDIYAVPNGVRVGKRQAWKLKQEGLRAGRPDISIDRGHGGFFGMRIEAKVRKYPSAAQKRIIARLTKMNYYTPVGRGLTQMKHLTLDYLARPMTVAR